MSTAEQLVMAGYRAFRARCLGTFDVSPETDHLLSLVYAAGYADASKAGNADLRRLTETLRLPIPSGERAEQCIDGEEHEWVGLTRHADPPGMQGVLPNAICERCSEQRFIPIPARNGLEIGR